MPRFIRSKYQQYKQDTQQLSTWLALTAINYGFPLDKFASSPHAVDPTGDAADTTKTAQQVKNAKKNAKKKAKAKRGNDGESSGPGVTEVILNGEGERPEGESVNVQDANIGTSPEPVTGNYLLSIPQFKQLALYLVDKHVTVPIEFLRLVRRCIDARCDTQKQFAPNTDASATHQHFISVLGEVEQILRSTSSAATAKAAANGADGVKSATNRFSALHIEEAADNDEDQADIFLPEPARSTSSTSAAGSKATFVPEVARDDAIWAILDFFTDVVRVRNYVRELWTAYKVGEVDLITASVTTNTALELLREPHNDLQKTMLPVITDEIPHLQLILYNFLAALNGRPITAPLPLFTNVSEDDALMTSLYDYLLVPNCQIVMGFAQVITNETLPFYKPGHYGRYDPTFGARPGQTGTPDRNFSSRWKSSMVLLCESFVEYLYLLDYGQKVVPSSPSLFDEPVGGPGDANIFYIDEIACEMESFRRKTKQISLLLLICSQIFLDINIVLGSDAARGHKDMKQALSGMRTSLSQRKATESSVFPETWPKENEKVMDGLREEIEFWSKSDPVEISKKVAQKSLAVTENNFMQRSPMLCGLVLFRIRLTYQHVSLLLANAWATISSTAHLYLACRLYDKLPGQKPLPVWPDMELILDLHGRDDTCGGYKIEKVEDALAAHLKMMGYSDNTCDAIRAGAAGSELEISRHRRKAISTQITHTGRIKGLTDHTQIIPIFQQRYLANSMFRTKLDIKAIQKLLEDLDRSPEMTVTSSQGITGGEKVRRGGKKKKQLRRTRKHKSPKFSIVQLLAVIEAGLDTETTALRIDYVALHLRCIRVLKKVQASAHDYLVKKHGTGYIQDDSQLPSVVAWILLIASLAERNARSVGITSSDSGGPVVASRLLTGATGALKEWLADRKEARTEVDRVGVQSLIKT